MPGHRGDDDVAEQVVAERADGQHPGPQLGQVDAGTGGRARGRGPDFLQPGAALAGRDRLDRPAEHVQDVRAEHGHRAPGGDGPVRLAHEAAAALAVAAAPGLGRDLVEFGGRQDRGFAVGQRQPVRAGQPLQEQSPVVRLREVAAVGDRPVVAQDDGAAAVHRLDGRRGQARRPEAHVGRDADRAAEPSDRVVDGGQLRARRRQGDDLGRVRVHDGRRAGRRVDRQVHRRLGGRRFRLVVPGALPELGAVQRDEADVAGPHVRVADPGRGDRHDIAGTNADIARAADGQPVVKQACAVADELRASRLQLVGVPAIHLPRILDGRPTKN